MVVKLPAAAQSAALQPPPPPPPPPVSLSYTSLGLAWRGFHPSSQSDESSQTWLLSLRMKDFCIFIKKHNACVASSRRDSFYPQVECYVTTLRLSLLGDIIGGEIIDTRYNLPSYWHPLLFTVKIDRTIQPTKLKQLSTSFTTRLKCIVNLRSPD